MLLRLDHLVLAVPDPEVAAAELEQAVGLTSTGGGRHPLWGTYNRLAWLGDTYVELIGVFDRTLAPTGAVSSAALAALDAGHAGLVSYALATDNLDDDLASLRAAGSALGEVEARSRTRLDGAVIRWRAVFPPVLGPADPPFVIEHEPVGAEWSAEARAARASLAHPIGGPARILGLELPVPDVATTAAAYAATTGLKVDPTSATTHIGEQWVRLVPGSPLADPAVIELGVELVAGADYLGSTEHGVPREIDALGVRWRIRGYRRLVIPDSRKVRSREICLDPGAMPPAPSVPTLPSSPRTAAAPWTADQAVTTPASAMDPGPDREPVVQAANRRAQLRELPAIGGPVPVGPAGRAIDVEGAVRAHDDVSVRR